MISVCMAAKNGAAFLEEQVGSILPQLSRHDEIVVSDDGSSDQTLKMLENIGDPRIRVFKSPGKGIVRNFENSLSQSRGDLIFLSDQDDTWAPSKLKTMRAYLDRFDMVISDCTVVGNDRQVQINSFFEANRSGKGFVRNLIRNSYMGCCMAFHRRVLERALPFPTKIPLHDSWLGLVAELHYHTFFLNQRLVKHRRHASNASSTGGRSAHSYPKRLLNRYYLLSSLVKRNLWIG